MTSHLRPYASGARVFALALLAGVSAPFAFAQQAAAPTPDAAALARYDKNHNGKLDPDEIAAMEADQKRPVPVATMTTDAAPDSAVVLSPFEVKEGNSGYFAGNTVSGTRLNSKIEDLAASISVVTKQQMADFAMLDINDVFNYTASTEGTGNFTDFAIDRNGMVVDNIQNNPQGANRIRGVGAANIALNNFATSGRVPVDPINLDGIEISRGPNSNIFGLGQGSGTVNLIGATANLRRSSSVVEARVDSVGGFRGSIDLNRPFFQNRVALRISAVNQHDAYNEKPSGTTTRRYNAMLRAQPFKSTSVTASFQSYDLYGTRASSGTPRDAVSYWKSVGSPVWDPTTTTVTVNGVSTVAGATTPLGLSTSTFIARPTLFIDNGGIQLWEIQEMPGATATNGPNSAVGPQRLLETIPAPVRTGHPLYATVPGLASKALFDWSKINLAGINSIYDHNETSTVSLEQSVLNSELNKLAFQLGWNRENANRFNKNVVGQSTGFSPSNYLFVDVNSKLLDGRPNPYFLRPYLGYGDVSFAQTPYQRDTFRGQLAYILDGNTLTGWKKWIGRHQLVGYMEERLVKTHSYNFKDVNITDNPIYSPAGLPKGNGAAPLAPVANRTYNRFYVGDNVGQNVDYSPSPYQLGNYTFNWFNPIANKWVGDTLTLGEAGIQEGTAGNFASQTLTKTRGGMVQSSVLQDRLIATFGKRHDENDNKFQRPSVLKPDGYTFDYAAMNGWVGPWAVAQGDTTTQGFVVKPFQGWKFTAENRGFFSQLLEGFNVHYNKSDSFLPSTPAVSVLLQSLPNPTSNGNDYGFSLNLFDRKLVIRANRYTTNQINSRNSQFGTFGTRTLRVDLANFAGNADQTALQAQARLWTAALNPSFTAAQVDDAVYKIMGLSSSQVAAYNSNSISETQDVTAKGDELELNYNPDPYWTLQLNITKTISTNAHVAPNIPVWVAQRTPTWTSIIDPRTNTPWFTTIYGAQTPQAFLQGVVLSPIALAQAVEGKSLPEIRQWHYNLSTSVRLAKYTEQRVVKNMSVGGSVRWESKGAIGYYGIPINGDIAAATAYDPSRPIWSKANTYLDAFASYSTHLWHDKVRAKFQLNARNIQEWKARLSPIAAFPDGTPNTYRIIEPMQFIFTSTFEL